MPASDRVILDCGSKTLSSDAARGFESGDVADTLMKGHGLVFRELAPQTGQRPDENLIIERLSEEHANVRVVTGSTPLVPGDLVRVLPNHACVVTNLVDDLWLLDANALRPLRVAARGRIQ